MSLATHCDWRACADVHMQSYFRSERFPDNLPADVWEPQWAHLASAGGAAVVLGEPCVEGVFCWHALVRMQLISDSRSDSSIMPQALSALAYHCLQHALPDMELPSEQHIILETRLENQLPYVCQASGCAWWPGEWGGFSREGSMDCAWQDRLAAFLIARGLSGGFYWCLNCNSGDTVRTALESYRFHLL